MCKIIQTSLLTSVLHNADDVNEFETTTSLTLLGHVIQVYYTAVVPCLTAKALFNRKTEIYRPTSKVWKLKHRRKWQAIYKNKWQVKTSVHWWIYSLRSVVVHEWTLNCGSTCVTMRRKKHYIKRQNSWEHSKVVCLRILFTDLKHDLWQQRYISSGLNLAFSFMKCTNLPATCQSLLCVSYNTFSGRNNLFCLFLLFFMSECFWGAHYGLDFQRRFQRRHLHWLTFHPVFYHRLSHVSYGLQSKNEEDNLLLNITHYDSDRISKWIFKCHFSDFYGHFCHFQCPICLLNSIYSPCPTVIKTLKITYWLCRPQMVTWPHLI